MQNKRITQKQNTRFVMRMTYKYEFKKYAKSRKAR